VPPFELPPSRQRHTLQYVAEGMCHLWHPASCGDQVESCDEGRVLSKMLMEDSNPVFITRVRQGQRAPIKLTARGRIGRPA